MLYLGDYAASSVIRFPWSTNGADGASITRATDGTLRVYKNSSTTERTSSNGITQTEDFDSVTGVHMVSIDTADNTDAGFFAAGNEYCVVMVGMVIDGKTVNAPLACFSIENRNIKANVTQWSGTNVPTPSTAGYPLTDAALVAGDSSAATALKSQFNGTGLIGDSYPATQDQIALRLQVTQTSTTTFTITTDVAGPRDFVGKACRMQATAGGDSTFSRVVSHSYSSGTDLTTFTIADPHAGSNGGSRYLWIEPRPGMDVAADGSISGMSAADVWTYASRTLTANSPQVIETQQFEERTLVQGNSYSATARDFTFTKASDAAWPTTLSEWTWTFTAEAVSGNDADTQSFTGTVDVLVDTGASQQFRVTILKTATTTALGRYNFVIHGEKSGEDWDAVIGTLLVRASAH